MAKIQDLGGSEEGSRWWSGEEVGDGSEQDRGKRGKVSMEATGSSGIKGRAEGQV